MSHARLPITACATTILSYFDQGPGNLLAGMPGPPCPCTGDHQMSVTVAMRRLGRVLKDMIGLTS